MPVAPWPLHLPPHLAGFLTGSARTAASALTIGVSKARPPLPRSRSSLQVPQAAAPMSRALAPAPAAVEAPPQAAWALRRAAVLAALPPPQRPQPAPAQRRRAAAAAAAAGGAPASPDPSSLPPYYQLSLPVYSLATAAPDGGRPTMNLVTYAAPISLKPRHYALGLYLDTLSWQNMLATRTGVLQARGQEAGKGAAGRGADRTLGGVEGLATRRCCRSSRRRR